MHKEDRDHLASSRRPFLANGLERIQRLQLPDLKTLSLGPEVILVFLVEFHRFLMVLGDLDTELMLNRGTVEQRINCIYLV